MEAPVLLLAGGLGTRIKHLLQDVPKPMAPVLGKPFLEYQFRYLERFGFKKFYLSIGYLSQVVIDYFDQTDLKSKITYIRENEPLGTGGAINYAMDSIVEDEFYCLNADTLFLANFQDFRQKIISQKYSAAVGLMRMDNVSRYGRVEITQGLIRKFHEKDPDFQSPALINAGIYYFKKERLESINIPRVCSLEKDIFPILIQGGLGYWETDAQFIDIGTPETLRMIEDFVTNNHLV